MTQLVKMGRLAMRIEGVWWVAYYAAPDTMAGAFELGRIRIRHVEVQARRKVFMDLMQEAVSDLIEDTVGARPVWPHPPEVAPEHEREGVTHDHDHD